MACNRVVNLEARSGLDQIEISKFIPDLVSTSKISARLESRLSRNVGISRRDPSRESGLLQIFVIFLQNR